MRTASLATLAALALAAAPLHAQPVLPPPSDDGGEAARDEAMRDRPRLRPAHKPRDVVIDVPNERPGSTKLVLAATLGLGAIAGGIGVYFHLDSRSATRDVEAIEFVGEAWTQEDVDLVDRAARSRGRAALAYGIGGAFVIGAIVAFIATDPGSERSVIRTGASASLVPGGGMAFRTWSF